MKIEYWEEEICQVERSHFWVCKKVYYGISGVEGYGGGLNFLDGLRTIFGVIMGVPFGG